MIISYSILGEICYNVLSGKQSDAVKSSQTGMMGR